MNGRERVEELLLQFLADMAPSAYCLDDPDVRSSFVDSASRKWDAALLVDAIARDLDAPMRWRPIEEAPKEPETRILLLLPTGEAVTAEWRRTRSGMPWVHTKTGRCWGEVYPTHWCPLTPQEKP